MNIKDLTRDVLVDIVEGVDEARKEIKNYKASIPSNKLITIVEFKIKSDYLTTSYEIPLIL